MSGEHEPNRPEGLHDHVQSFPLRNFTDLLRIIAKKPCFYLAPDQNRHCRSIRELSSFITGFEMGQYVKDNISVLAEFNFWICHRYGQPGASWYVTLLERAGGDEVAAFDLFFGHFEEYLKEREAIGAEAIKTRFLEMIKKLSGEA
jgi:hypothetical protein